MLFYSPTSASNSSASDRVVGVEAGFSFPACLIKLTPVLLVFIFALPLCAQEFVPEQVVFPITDFKPDIKHFALFGMRFGTGFCLDPGCRFVGTNYHVAKIMGEHIRIKGVRSAHRYLYSSPKDAGAEDVSVGGGASMKYAPAHDLAIYEMSRPLKNYRGVSYESDELMNSCEVDIYAYPYKWKPKRGLVRWHGNFVGETPQGLYAFRYDEGSIRGGASGGIVIDSKTKRIVGVLSGMGEGKERIALAVPVRELSEFVEKAEPYLQATLFPKTVFVSPVAQDLYRPYVWPRGKRFSDRAQESFEVIKLRDAAQNLAESMRNFTAIQTFAWGHDNHEPEMTDAYETLVVDGRQSWRRHGKDKFQERVPFPLLPSIVPGSEWSDLPLMVGTALDLKIHQAPDATVGGRSIRVFQYSANAEDEVCAFRSVMHFVLFQRSATNFYDCHGEVWVDDAGTILRISRTVDLSGPWYREWEVITYNWLEKNGRRHLVPVTIMVQAEQGKTFWCRGLFTDYEMFDVKSRLVLPSGMEKEIGDRTD